ncbi:MAG: non-ribosomal peptide synthetase [Blastocatellia bacterium AA13]|nr:MAG: non-ribosomal peptide synthetase [Blastocatellia bacterium AA13]
MLEELEIKRDLSTTPVFQVMFNMLNFPHRREEVEGIEIELEKSAEVGSKFDLTMYIGEEGEEIAINGTYDASLYEEERIKELMRQYEAVLEQAVKDTEIRIEEISLRTEKSEEVLPDPEEELSGRWEGTVVERVIERAKEAGQRAAIRETGKEWSYAEVEEASRKIAAKLKRAGVRRGEAVGIWGERTGRLVVSVLGVMRAGAAFLILEGKYPGKSLRERLEISGARVVIEASGKEKPEELERYIEEAGIKVISANEERASIEGAGLDETTDETTEWKEEEIGAEDIAYISFTSGSTGTPKAVLGKHGSLTHFIPWLCSEFKLNGQDRFSMLSGLSHDPLQRDMFTPLSIGATICIPREEEIAGSEQLAEWLKAERITISHLTPAMAQLISGSEDEHASREIESLRYAFIVGDILTRRDIERLNARAQFITCVNFYGATETQRAVGYFVVSDEYRGNDDGHGTLKQTIPLGKGMPDVQLLVLNKRMALAGIGEKGEIYVRSPHIAAGYLNDEALTAERFITNPFTDIAGDRLYRTGDLGRYLPDGAVEPLGRADRQVKLRGYRIELGEIESAIGDHPMIDKAVVVLRESEDDGDMRLIAYAVTRAGETVTSTELRSFLKNKLPEYMTPSALVLLGELPLTPTGKIDRKALPAPTMARPNLNGLLEEARTPVEQLLTAIWEQVLGTGRIGRLQNFFECGGHSLLATQVVSRVRCTFNVELPLRSLFETPTVAGLAETIETLLTAKQGLQAPPVITARKEQRAALIPAAGPSAPREEAAYPLSFAQQRLWLAYELDPEDTSYNIPAVVELMGSLNYEALTQALAEVIRRHEILRTRFEAVDGAPIQVVHSGREFDLKIIEIDAAATGRVEQEASRLATECAREPFDLRQGSPLRARLVRIDATRHLLLLTIHHIAADGGSMNLLSQEMSALYKAFANGQPSILAEPAIQYGDFAVRQREWLAGEALENQLAYWRRRFGGELPVLELPLDHPRPAVWSHRGAHEPLMLSAGLCESLSELNRREGVTLFMTLAAAFKILLHRYSGQEDVIIGTPIASRNRAELEGSIGPFINVIPLRTDFSGAPTVREFLRKIREEALAAYSHQDAPFEKIISSLQRDAGRSPLFQVLFTLQNRPASTGNGSGLTINFLQVENGGAKYDLSLSLVADEANIGGNIEYNTDLFEQQTIERMAGHLTTILESMTENLDQPVYRIQLLTSAERARALSAFEASARCYPDQSVKDLFEAGVDRAPDAVAVVYEGQHLSYLQLDRRANHVARWLRLNGVVCDEPVGICTDRSLDMAVAVLGVVKSGAAYLPLDPAYPIDRLAFMLQDSGARLVITQEQFQDVLPQGGPQSVCIDRDWTMIASHSRERIASISGGENLAYVIYTSGSTGRPKGVQISHRALVNFLWSMRDEPGIAAEDVVLSATSLSFDIMGLELYLPLLFGAKLVLVPRTVGSDAAELAIRIAESRATMMQATPATWRMLLQGGWGGESRLKILCGGEAMPEDLPAALLERSASLWNMYGPTETTIWSMIQRIEQDDAITIGRPIANTQVYLLDMGDRAAEPAPIGVAGGLMIGGDGLARGYLNRPELTAEKFTPDPFSHQPGARLYAAGDLAKYRTDDRIEFIGRADHQVKIRGFRIELGEIETALLAHEAVAQAIVIAGEDNPGEKRLVAYVVTDRGYLSPDEEGSRDESLDGRASTSALTSEAINDRVQFDEIAKRGIALTLRSHLAKQLPDYMVPSAVVVMNELPLTPNGKIDRKQLPRPDQSRTQIDLVEPRTPEEKMLCGIWSDALGIDPVGIEDNFFELGGDSIIGIQIIARANEAGLSLRLEAVGDQRSAAGENERHEASVSLKPKHLFQYPTIAALAARTSLIDSREEAAEMEGTAASVVALDSDQTERIAANGEVEDFYPLSPMQHGMLFQTLYAPQSGIYCDQVVSRLQGELDVEAFKAAWTQVVGRHHALRTSFEWEGLSEPLQIVRKNVAVDVRREDWSKKGELERTEDLEEYLRQDRERGFDLVTAPLMRLLLIEIGEREFECVWTWHHLLMDGWCVSLILKDLFTIYEALVAHREPELGPVVPYRDYIDWLSRQDLAAAEAYWREALNGYEPNALERRNARFEEIEYAREFLELDASTAARLQTIARSHQLTIHSITAGAWAILLARLNAQDDVVFGTTVSGRPAELRGVEKIVGLFINTLPFRVRLDNRSPLIDWLKRIQVDQTEMRQYEYSPLARIQKWSEIPAGEPLFESVLIFQNYPVEPAALDAQRRVRVQNARFLDRPSYPLGLTVAVGAEMAIAIHYDTGRFDSAAAKAMLNDLAVILSSVVERPADTLQDVQRLLGRKDERRRKGKEQEYQRARKRKLREARLKPVSGAKQIQEIVI